MNAADTNVWLYAVDHREPIKRQRAYDLLEPEKNQKRGQVFLFSAVEPVRLRRWQDSSEFIRLGKFFTCSIALSRGSRFLKSRQIYDAFMRALDET